MVSRLLHDSLPFFSLTLECAPEQVQHMQLTDSAVADTATVDLIVNLVHWFFPSIDYRCYSLSTLLAT